jgi:hypothetical protein
VQRVPAWRLPRARNPLIMVWLIAFFLMNSMNTEFNIYSDNEFRDHFYQENYCNGCSERVSEESHHAVY